MRLWLAAIALGAAVAGAPAAALAGAATPSDAKNPTAKDPDKIVCRNDETTGSRIPTRVCHSQRDWDAMSSDSREKIQDIQDRSTTATPLRGG